MHKTHLVPAIVLIALAFSGCLTDSDEGFGRNTEHITLGPDQTARVLAFVNYPGTDFELLDQGVRLDRRAAENIVTYRNGNDGLTPSADDQLFTDLDSLVAVPYVANSALQKLDAYAAANPPPPEEIAEGVLFSGWEREAVLWGVNTLGADVLRGLALNTTQANNVVAYAPFASINELANVPQIGPATLTKLRNAAAELWHAWRGGFTDSMAGTYDGVAFDHDTAVIALEIANLASHETLTGAGVFAGGATAIVGARPFDTLAAVADTHGVGAATMSGLHAFAISGDWSAPTYGTTQEGYECFAHGECAEGLACMGLTIGFALCLPTWMAGTFSNNNTRAIPDGGGITSSLTVSNLASVPMDVILHVDIDHPRKSDLQIVLEQPGYPSGASAMVWPAGSDGPATVVVNWGIERDAQVNGTWKLYVTDTVTGEVGTLKSWTLDLNSRWD